MNTRPSPIGFLRAMAHPVVRMICGLAVLVGALLLTPEQLRTVPAATAQTATFPYRLFAPGAAAAGTFAGPVVSEIRDPDEAAFGTNDLGLVRVTASESSVRVRVESADGQPFVIQAPGTGVIVRFYWFLRPEGGEADYIQVVLFGDRADVYQLDTSTGAGRFTHSTIAYTKSGSALEFELTRSRFRAAARVSWAVYGSGGGLSQDLAPNDDDANPNQSGAPPAVIDLP